MKFTLGIDLGTTNSVVSVYRRGNAETLSIEGHKTFPSVVSFKDKDTMLVGRAAKNRLILDPEHSVGSVKRFMGNRKRKFKIFGKEYSPIQISSFILKKMVEEAANELGEEVKDVIITVPAYFTDAQKEDTRDAGEAAGLNVLRLIAEPTAAAIAYGLDKGKDQTIMVYDLGGGTFDVAILQVVKNDFNVLAVDGDSQLGGDDFDNAIVDHLLDRFKTKTGKDIKDDFSKDALVAKQKLKEEAEKAKWELSQAQSTEINIPEIMGESIEEVLTLDQYNELIKPLLDKTIKKIHAVLKEADLSSGDINRVILVGGSTRNTAVKEIVSKEIKEPYISDQVDEEVSHGAAILGASLTLPEEDFTPIAVQERMAHSLGVELLDDKNRPYFTPIIPKNSEYPINQGLIAFTVRPFQEQVLLEVFRGESKYCKDNTKMGQLRLKISNLSKDQVPLGAIFELDADGILKFSCVELPINIGDEEIRDIVYAASYNKGILDYGAVKELMARGTVKFVETQITAV
ncbi:MAG: Hsp70 family protein [bacterium]